MLDYIYKYTYVGTLHRQDHIDDIEIILFNNNIHYKLKKVDAGDAGVEVYVALLHEELGKEIVDNLKKDNLIYKKLISFEDIKIRKSKSANRNDYRKIMMILFIIMLIILFMRSLSLLNIMN